MAAVLGTSYPLEDTGLVAISAVVAPITDDDNGVPGVTYTPDRTATSYYLDENEIPSLDLDATTFPSGVGGFIELEAGTIEVAVGGTAMNCVVTSGWAGTNASSLQVPVREGFITQAFVTCDEVAAP